MKIIVDEMPKSAEDCVFGTGEEKYCVINNKDYCGNSANCQYLKPITDFHAEKVIEKHNDGSCTVQQFEIR